MNEDGLAVSYIRDNNLNNARVVGRSFIANGDWHYITGIRDEDMLYLYVDGKSEGAPADTRAVGDVVGPEPLTIGIGEDYLGVLSAPFPGNIDDVRIYGRALSAAEVLWIYESVPKPPKPEVYHVDGVGGNDLNDGLGRATAFATIQKGIDSSVDGGEVIVWPGVYSEAVNFLGKGIMVHSGGDAAVIEASGQDAVTFHSGEGRTSVLKNFVIRNSALGISANYGSSPTLTNLTIVDNDYGIAAYEDSHPDISNCILWDNRDGDMWGCQARYSFVEQEMDTGPVDGLVGHWKFNEGSGSTAYDSAGANNASINGAQWVMGQIGGALGFDGTDDYVKLSSKGIKKFQKSMNNIIR